MTPLILSNLLLASLVSPGFPDISRAVGLYGRGQYQQAIDLLAAGTDPSGHSVEGRLWLGKAHLKLRRWDEAIRELELAAKAEPGNCLLRLWLGRAYGRKASHVVFYRAFGLAGKVREEFERARSLCPDNPEVRFDLLEFYVQAPGMIGGGKDKAKAEAQEIARLNPRMGYPARARIAESEKDWNLARRELESGVRSFPSDASARCDLAEHLFRRQSPAEAADSARRALQLRGDYPRAQFLLAASQITAGEDLPGAVTALDGLSRRTLLDEDPPFQEIYYWLGRGLLALDRKAEALQALETALRFDPDHPEARATLQEARGKS